MSIEYRYVVLHTTENVVTEIQKLLDEGWIPIPGAIPLLVYHLQRDLAAMAPAMGMAIDETKITIIKAKPEGD